MTSRLERFSQRPTGTSSKLTRLRGASEAWLAPNGQVVELPVEVDLVHKEEINNSVVWVVVAKIALVNEAPSLVSLKMEGSPRLDPEHLQRFFRWRTPLEIVLHTVPQLIAKGVDPYSYDYATTGYPEAAFYDRPLNKRLSDEFLQTIAQMYSSIGRGYACAIAGEYGVSRRTVVSWVEKARKRGLLPPTKAGKPTF